MKTLHGGPYPVPGETGRSLGDADEEKGEEADEHVRGDAVVFVVVEGAELKSGLEGPERPFHLEELLVAQCHVLGRETVVTRGEDVLPVEAGLVGDLSRSMMRAPFFC